MNCEFPDVQAGFRKGRGSRVQTANIQWIIKKAREFQKNIYCCFIDYTKAFECVYHNKLWKIFKEMGITDHLTCLLRNQYAGQEATELDMDNRLVPDWERCTSRLYIVTLAYLTYMQSTSSEILGWMKHKLESRLLGELSIASDMQMTPPLWQKAKRN